MKVSDQVSGQTFLVDSGADESVFPASAKDRLHLPKSEDLVAANGTAIATYGKRKIKINLSGRSFIQDFWIANVSTPILGADFYINNKIGIDLSNRKLVDTTTWRPIGPTRPAKPAAMSVSFHCARPDAFEAILDEFPDLLIPHFKKDDEIKHKVKHHIITTGPPVHARARRLDAEKLEIAKSEFKTMEDMGIVRRSDSPWASPLHMAPKPDGGVRPCGDFRALNVITEDDRYPLPHIQDFNGGLAGKKIFSVIDLVRGFHHIPVAEEDVPKTAVITPFGLFEFVRMPFGLKNAAQAFQRLMDGILRDIPFTFVYLDDILVASSSPEEHADHIRQVLQLLSKNGITVNKKKCVFGKSEL